MRFASSLAAALLIGSACAVPLTSEQPEVRAPAPRGASSQATFQQLLATAQKNAKAALKASKGSCTAKNIVTRKEWSTFTKPQKKAYTDAVLCVQKNAALTPKSLVPGAVSRFDDFVGTHINQTLNIHYTGTFLAWHRWFLWNYESVLRNECGYTGYQPYWNWGLTADDVTKPGQLFDGSDCSMSGNGAYIPNRGDLQLTLGNFPIVYLPAGTGGGCVTSGPFKNMTVNLGPVSLPINGGGSIGGGPGTGLTANPRCLKRDLATSINALYANFTSIVNLIQQNDNIADFQFIMQGVPGSGSIGVHGGGHYTIGGDPGGDTFTSPGDPAFYLHHGMIDLVWWVWQNLDLPARQNAISGTGTFLDGPPSANTTLETVIDIGYAVPLASSSIKMSQLMSTIQGPFCYTYA